VSDENRTYADADGVTELAVPAAGDGRVAMHAAALPVEPAVDPDPEPEAS
jgi:hypothetical protein